MELFEDQAEQDVARAVTLVEQTVEALGIDPAQVKSETGGGGAQFSLRRGSAEIVVAVRPGSGKGSGTIRVVAPVVRLPASERFADLARELLAANAMALVGVAFGVVGDEVVLVSERSVQDLDGSEVAAMLKAVGKGADRYDDELATKYGTSRSSDAEG